MPCFNQAYADNEDVMELAHKFLRSVEKEKKNSPQKVQQRVPLPSTRTSIMTPKNLSRMPDFLREEKINETSNANHSDSTFSSLSSSSSELLDF